MKKLRYTAGLKAAAVAAGQILSVILVLCIVLLALLFQKNILSLGGGKEVSFETSGYFENQFQAAAGEVLNFVELRRKFETEGSYDADKAADIWQYYEHLEVVEKAPRKEKKNTVKYRLGDLAEWSREYTSSSYEFSSEFRLEEGIQQKQSIYKNGESVFSEEKTITSLKEMSLELQESIIENVEHFYGGSYSTSSKSCTEALDYTELEEQDSENAASADESAGMQQSTAVVGYGSAADSQEMVAGDVSVNTEVVSEEKKDSKPEEEIVQKVISGKLYELNSSELEWLLADMKMSYANSISQYEFVDEDYLPIDGTGIWDRFMKGNFSVDEMRDSYLALSYTLENIGEEISQYRRGLNRYNNSKDGTNVRYWVTRDTTVYTNIENIRGIELPAFGEQLGRYLYYQEKESRLATNVNNMDDYFYERLEPVYGSKGNVLFVGVDTSFPNHDSFWEAKQEYSRMYPWIRVSLWGAVFSFLLGLICMIYLSTVAGKRDETGKVYLNLFDRIPTEIQFLLAAGGILFFLVFMVQVFYRTEIDALPGILFAAGGLTFLGSAFLQIFYLSFVRRIRAGVLWSGSILRWFIHGIGQVFTSRKSVTKMVLWFGLHLLACLVILLPVFSAASYDGELFWVSMFFFLLLCGVEAVLIIREGIQRNKVLEGIGKISQGDMEYKIPVEELRLAEAVNAIGEGLYHAVDDSMKNERLKADLITNVSHDIKTPLTSIINYVDLLKREELKDPRVQNYIAVLDSKSQRLKQLAEDLVEASKISSGNITLNMERINLVELVHQTEGEFAEKFEARSLKVVSNLPRESVMISADGRRIWRVLENLYNNVAKYAMEHTRVYVDMHKDGERVLFSIKNISENPLNIQADELTERFIRGDISRSTEGSGLGLSIAKNLTILMGGTFEIYLDGDLFKVMLGFCQEPEYRELPTKTEE